MPPSKNNPRAEYRLREVERANLSPGLAEKFPNLKSLNAELACFNPDGMTQTGALRYTANVAYAKSVFSFVCQSGECLAGGFDLSNAIGEAVTRRRKSAVGEIRCQGTLEGPNQSQRACRNVVRYKLTPGYV